MKCQHSGLEAKNGLPCRREIVRTTDAVGRTLLCDRCLVCAHVINSVEEPKPAEAATDETTEA